MSLAYYTMTGFWLELVPIPYLRKCHHLETRRDYTTLRHSYSKDHSAGTVRVSRRSGWTGHPVDRARASWGTTRFIAHG